MYKRRKKKKSLRKYQKERMPSQKNKFGKADMMNGKIDLKDYKDKLPADEMQWKAFGSEQGVYGIFKFAQKKYGNVSSWRNKCPESKSRYLSAMMRHLFKIKNGEAIDPESGLHHGAALAWNALSYLEFVIEDLEEK